jgi:hypothetical protein
MEIGSCRRLVEKEAPWLMRKRNVTKHRIGGETGGGIFLHCCTLSYTRARIRMDAEVSSVYFETAIFGSWLRHGCGRIVLKTQPTTRDGCMYGALQSTSLHLVG